MSRIENNNGTVKTHIIGAVSLAVAVSLLIAFPASGDYNLSWSTIDGGGGTSTGGQYLVRGTIGQHDAAYSQGQQYELLGGFWPGEPMCFINFEHFARFAEYWLVTGPDLPADLYEDNIVDLLDLKEFVDQWLYWCPYDWLLK